MIHISDITFQLVTECKNLITHADGVYERLLQAQHAGMEWHEELQPMAQQAGLKGRKLNKVHYSLAYSNIFIIKYSAISWMYLIGKHQWTQIYKFVKTCNKLQHITFKIIIQTTLGYYL